MIRLQVDGLTKSYGDRLLFADVTFGIEEGDKIGIVARNGTGKSTLLRIMAGLEEATVVLLSVHVGCGSDSSSRFLRCPTGRRP